MFKSIVVLISVLIFFSGCHRMHPVIATAVVVPGVSISPFVHHKPHNKHSRHHRYHRHHR